VTDWTNPYGVPVARAPAEARVGFLREVGLLTGGGLIVSGLTATISAAAILAVPMLLNRWVAMIVMLGAIFGSRALGGSMIRSPARSTQLAGFLAGSGLQGIAMGYLLLTATIASAELYSNPLIFLGQAFSLVGLTVLGMVAYLMTGPKNLSMVGSALSTLALPMLALMVFSWFFPVGGIFGILISAGFVAISAGGLLYNLNAVMHSMRTSDTVPAAYHVTMGILVLFWNVLVLLMRLQRR